MYKKMINEIKDAYLNDLFNLLRINSVLVEQPEVKDAPFGKGCVEALNYVLNLGKKMGFKTLNVDNVSGHIEFGEGKEILGILCHLDVVPTGDGWTNDPFDPTIRDGKIYARGVNDDKGAGMACLYALKILKDSGYVPNKRIRLIFGTDEETASRGVKHYLEVCETPNIGFSPDAEFPIIYGEKGIMSIDIISKQISKDIIEIKSGDRYNIVPEQAYAKLNKDLSKEYDTYLKENDFKGEVNNGVLKSQGLRAHAMEPRNGKNALLRLFNFLNGKVDNKLISFTSKYLNDSLFKDINLNYTHEEMGDLTVNVAVADINSNGGKIGMNLRYPIGWDKEYFLSTLKSKAKEYDLEIDVISDSNPHYVSPKGELIEKLHEAYVEVTHDDKTPLMTIGGGTYARMFENAVAFGPAFPGREEVAHNTDEYMSIEDLLMGMEIYIKAIEKLGK